MLRFQRMQYELMGSGDIAPANGYYTASIAAVQLRIYRVVLELEDHCADRSKVWI